MPYDMSELITGPLNTLIEPVAKLKGELDEWIGVPSEIFTKGKRQVWLRWRTQSGLPMLEIAIYEDRCGHWRPGGVTCPFQNTEMWDKIQEFGGEYDDE